MRSEEKGQYDSDAEAPDIEDLSPRTPPVSEEEVLASAEAMESVTAAEVDALHERYLRLAAEYDNYRKRTERERAESRDRSQAQIVERLLETIDDLQRVAQLDEAGTTIEALLEGIRMVERKLVRSLEAEGLEPMDARGKTFDPSIHEALMTAPTSDVAEDHTIGEVFQPGYLFRGNLLRPARVQVRKHEG